MEENIDQVFKYIQKFSQEKTLLTIGSGISIGEGISGMDKLSDYLCEVIEKKLSKFTDLNKNALTEWNDVKNALENEMGLEQALSITDISSVIEDLIRTATCNLIGPEDQKVFKQVFLENRQLGLTPLLRQLTPTNSYPLTIITTNYDCLVEYTCLSLGLKVDNLFYGDYIRQFAPNERAKQHQKLKRLKSGNRIMPTSETDYVLLLKPHGSIDWFSRPGKGTYLLQNSGLGVSDIITPGKGKWKSERREPFNSVYAACNCAIDSATAYMFLGYGYNDEDLQDHYSHDKNKKKPKLIVTKESNDQLDQLLDESVDCMLIQQSDNGTCIQWKQDNKLMPGLEVTEPFWKIDYLVQHVFRED